MRRLGDIPAAATHKLETSVTGIYSRNGAPRVRAVVQGGSLLLLLAAVASLTASVNVQQGSFALEFVVLLAAAALTRRFGIPLPGQGFSSMILAVAWIALFLRGWPFAVLIIAIGTASGDLFFRRLSIEQVRSNVSHIVAATGIVGLIYSLAGGALGRSAITLDNVGPIAIAVAALAVLANTLFYLEIVLSRVGHIDWRLPLRWDGITALMSARTGTRLDAAGQGPCNHARRGRVNRGDARVDGLDPFRVGPRRPRRCTPNGRQTSEGRFG